MKRILSFLFTILILLSTFTSCKEHDVEYDKDKITIVTTIFPYYDFAREIAGDKANIVLLISPGTESHDYEPSPKDIVKINNADIFIYNGGKSDDWVKTVLSSLDNSVRALSMFDYVTPLCAESGHDHDHSHGENEHHHGEFDEHIWTSPANAITLSQVIYQELIKVDQENSTYYQDNFNFYSKKLKELDNNFIELTHSNEDNHEHHATIVIADRFPMRYFTERYHIEYKSAFPGCSSQTQPSIKTVTGIIPIDWLYT